MNACFKTRGQPAKKYGASKRQIIIKGLAKTYRVERYQMVAKG
jgi:hypothetical protein